MAKLTKRDWLYIVVIQSILFVAFGVWGFVDFYNRPLSPENDAAVASSSFFHVALGSSVVVAVQFSSLSFFVLPIAYWVVADLIHSLTGKKLNPPRD